MASNAYVDITTDCGLFFKTSPTIYMSLDTNPAVTPSFTTGTLGVNSNITSGILAFGGPLSAGTHTIYVSFSYSQLNILITHGYKCLVTLMFDGQYPVARQFYVVDNGTNYSGYVVVTL